MQRKGPLGLAFIALMPMLGLTLGASAQVIRDGSIGPSAATQPVGPNFQIGENLGELVGRNLFHSFSRFDLSSTQSATFNAVSAVDNVLSRVTGGAGSFIDGNLASSIAGANVFLINPSGMIFGPNASLNVQGAFHATTASYVDLGTSGRFDALEPGASTLSAEAPSAFGFVSAGRDIVVNGSALSVPGTRSMTLAGGNISMTDATLSAPQGQVNLIATAGAGRVSISGADPKLASGMARGSVRIAASSPGFLGNVDTSGLAGGRIVIRSGNLFLDGGRLKSQGFGSTDGRGVDIGLTGTLTTTGNASIDTRTIGTGKAGGITLRAANAEIGGNTSINADTQFTGSAGNVLIDAQQVALRDNVRVSADTFGSGTGGNVTIRSRDLTTSDFAFISARTALPGAGPAGRITISADAMQASGEATIDASSFLFSSGDGGSIVMNLGTLEMTEDAWIISNTFTGGTGGTIDIDANQISLLGRNAISTSTFSSGDAGDITVTANSLTMSGASVISSGTEGTGSAGTVTIRAGNLNATGRSTISSESEGSNFFVRGAPVPEGTLGGGRGGNVVIEAGSFIAEGASQITTGTGGSGQGGNLSISADDVLIYSQANISARSTGTGLAGNIAITANNTFQLLANGSVTTEANTSDGGNIDIKAGNLILVQDARITTSVSDGDGDGGNILIDPPFIVFDGATIIANANGGAGGNIRIVARALFADPTTVIDASSALGIDGSVIIESPGDDVSSSVTSLPADFLPADRLRIVRCAQLTRSDISTITVRPRDGLPPASDDLQAASRAPLGFAGSTSAAAHSPAAAAGKQPEMLASLYGCSSSEHF